MVMNAANVHNEDAIADDFDTGDVDSRLIVGKYVVEIFNYLKTLEVSTKFDILYLI